MVKVIALYISLTISIKETVFILIAVIFIYFKDISFFSFKLILKNKKHFLNI